MCRPAGRREDVELVVVPQRQPGGRGGEHVGQHAHAAGRIRAAVQPQTGDALRQQRREEPAPGAALLVGQPIVWDFIRGGVAFNRWLGAGLSRNNVRDMMKAVLADVMGPTPKRTLAEAVVYHMEVPQSVLNYLSQRNFAHARARGPNSLADAIVMAAAPEDDGGSEAHGNEAAAHRKQSMDQLRKWLLETDNNAGMGATSTEIMRYFGGDLLKVDGKIAERDDGSVVLVADSIANQLRNWSTRMSEKEKAALHLRREGAGGAGDPFRFFCTLEEPPPADDHPAQAQAQAPPRSQPLPML